ncbi:MAG: hypothetical protein EBR72_08300 [Bacteroidetes bacterium]|nr:hypothetical protein [Bacteroidota bacterium]
MFAAIQVLKRRMYFFVFLIHLVFSLNAQNLLSNYSIDWGDKGSHFNVVNLEHLGISKAESSDFIRNYLKLSKESSMILKFNNVERSEAVRFIHKIKGHTILGSEVVARFKGEVLTGFNGIIYNPLVSLPSIDAESAKQTAISVSGGKIFNWQVEDEEAMIKLWTLILGCVNLEEVRELKRIICRRELLMVRR